jgi:hypothetical protein
MLCAEMHRLRMRGVTQACASQAHPGPKPLSKPRKASQHLFWVCQYTRQHGNWHPLRQHHHTDRWASLPNLAPSPTHTGSHSAEWRAALSLVAMTTDTCMPVPATSQNSPSSKGCGLVVMRSHAEAAAAISGLDNYKWGGMHSTMVVKLMPPQRQRAISGTSATGLLHTQTAAADTAQGDALGHGVLCPCCTLCSTSVLLLWLSYACVC